MTDKTSTAPVMSLQKVRDALHEAHNSPGFEDVLDSCVAAIDAHLNAPTPDVVGGDVLAMLQAGFITACSHGPDKDYRLNIKFPTLAALHAAHNALVMAAPRVQGDAVVAEGYDVARHNEWLESNSASDAQPKGEYPECSGDAYSCPENEGYGCCGSKPHPAVQPKGNIVVGSWPWLRGVLSGMPSREEVLGGQRHRYLSRDEVLGWIDEGERRAASAHPAEQTRGDGVDEPPLAGWWSHGNGHLSCGGFRVARADWEHEVCAAGNMRNEVFDWMCARLNAKTAPRQAVPDELIADLRKFHEETEACDEFDLPHEATAALLAANLIEGTHFVLTAKGEAMLAAPSACTGDAS